MRKSLLIQKKSSTFVPDLQFTQCPDGGIGRRAGLKHQWIHFHAGSTPALGTFRNANRLYNRLLAFFVIYFCTTNCKKGLSIQK